jgi:hypothetical protein
MRLAKLLGIDDPDMTDFEIRKIIANARKTGKDTVTIKGVRIRVKRNETGKLECGILD